MRKTKKNELKLIIIGYFLGVKIRLFLRSELFSGFLGVKIWLFLGSGFFSGFLGVKVLIIIGVKSS